MTAFIRLTKKPAARLNGVDVSALSVGDISELPDAAARMLISEGWAEPASRPRPTRRSTTRLPVQGPDDRS